jgi:ribosomal protein S18 acetylase RimI-like enzyme
MRVQRLAISDYDEIISLWYRARLRFRPDGRDSKESMANQMMVNPDFFVGVFEDGRLVGTVVLSSDMRRGWINRLAVDPEYRRRGVAKTLIEESERILRNRGLKVFCSLIENSNKPSKALFKKCGYVEHTGISYFSKRDSDTV